MKGDITPAISPIECILGIFSDSEKAVGDSLERLADYDFKTVLIAVHPGIKTVIPGPGHVYYEVDDNAANQIAIASHGNPESLSLLLHISTSNIWNGIPVPSAFRPICFTILNGEKAGARQSGPKVGQGFGLFYLSTISADYVADAFRIPRVRVDGMDPCSASDMVVDALAIRGIELPYTRLRDWLTHRKSADNRVRADIISHRLNESLLISLGVVRGREHWHFGPYGPLGQSRLIGRMT